MPQKFVNLENLTSFWGNAKEYIGNERKKIEDQLYNWQKTEKAPMVQCEPVSNSELHPIVEFKFKETLPEGEKGPNNPSTITGISSIFVKCTNKNLISLPYHGESGTANGITWTVNSDKSVTANGTATADANFYFTGRDTTELMPAENNTYFLSGCPSGGSIYTYYLSVVNGANDTYVRAYDTGSGTIFKPKSSLVCVVHAVIKQGTTVNNITFKPQLEVGNNKTDYELTMRNQYTINLNDTYYGGSIDLATGVMTVTHWSHAFDGTEAHGTFIALENNGRLGFFTGEITAKSQTGQVCTHLQHLADYANDSAHFYANTGNNSGVILFAPYLTEEAFMSWLAEQYAAGTPVTVVCELKTPFTIQLTPQQIKSLSSLEGTSKRINTIYTDADSIQVEYQKYVGIDSTLDNNSINAIQNKVVNSALSTKVSLSGDETISGTKTFSNIINGSITGDASTVAGHIVSKDVPVNAAFTDTTYEPATQSTAGLMSASDKTKLDAVGSVFTFKGSVIDDTYLPTSDNASGDAYLAEDTGHVHVYDGTDFVDIGIWAGIPSATDAQIDALFED